MNRLIVAAASLLIVTGCDFVTSPAGGEVRVHTSVERFDAAESGAIPISFTVTNNTDRTVYVTRCGGSISSELQRRVDGAWESASAAFCPTDRDMSPLALPAGASADGVRTTWEPGEYRLRIGVARHYSTSPAWRTSNVFVVD